jgi:hypothetical protein
MEVQCIHMNRIRFTVYAGHEILKGDELHLAASLVSEHSPHYETAFASLRVDIEDFTQCGRHIRLCEDLAKKTDF